MKKFTFTTVIIDKETGQLNSHRIATGNINTIKQSLINLVDKQVLNDVNFDDYEADDVIILDSKFNSIILIYLTDKK